MSQTKRMSMLETATSTAIGLVVSLISNCVVFHFLHIAITAKENIGMTAFFTLVSIVRGYFVRRLFNKMHLQQSEKSATVELGIGAMTSGCSQKRGKA